jgi:Periplasmic binding protein
MPSTIWGSIERPSIREGFTKMQYVNLLNRRVVGCLFGVSVFGVAVYGPAAAAATIKLGSVLSITGPASFLGDPEDKTLKLYVDKINAAGGVAGKKIELIVYDDGGDANKARTFATRLLEDDRVVAMVGGSTTGTTMAMIPVFEKPRCRSFRSRAASRSSTRSGNTCSRRPTPTRWLARRSSKTSSFGASARLR